MKKYIKKLEIKPIITTISLVCIQSILYFISKLLQGDLNLVGNVIDTKIPFVPAFFIPYCIWYLMIFIIPYYLYCKDKDKFIKYTMAYILCSMIGNIVFISYPSTVARPTVTGTDIFSLIAKFIYWIDTPTNCFPSLHCAISMLFILYICESKNTNIITKISVCIISILIMLSTLFTKQHVVVDFISGDILALIVYLIVKPSKKLPNYIKIKLNI
jgi:membrane-associated phospholipid phosphatase